MGNLIAGTTIQGRTFNDIAIQKSKEGVPRPIVFGVARPIVGNVIATTEPKIITVREEAGGKGGGTEVENQEVYRTYAIRICEGPATVRRVWRNNKLVYDSRVEQPDYGNGGFSGIVDAAIRIATQSENNQVFRRIASFYTGSFSQMPSPVLEAVYGVGNVSAHRGTCYMVIDNENLTDNGGAIPQYAFEVVRSEGFVLTSKPYAVESEDYASVGVGVGEIRQRDVTEFVEQKVTINAIDLNTVVGYKNYDIDDGPIEVQVSVNSIDLDAVVGYQDHEIDDDAMEFQVSVDSIDLDAVVGYQDYDIDDESVEFEISVNSIQLVGV